jgi:hypothetical protein
VRRRARTVGADGVRRCRRGMRRMEWIPVTMISLEYIRRLTSCVLIVTDGSYAIRRRSDYRPRIDDRALTMAMMRMCAHMHVARMHWPTNGHWRPFSLIQLTALTSHVSHARNLVECRRTLVGDPSHSFSSLHPPYTCLTHEYVAVGVCNHKRVLTVIDWSC